MLFVMKCFAAAVPASVSDGCRRRPDAGGDAPGFPDALGSELSVFMG